MVGHGQMLAQSVRDVLAARCPAEVVLAAEARGEAPELWGYVESLGWPLASVPEERGGIGASFADACAILRIAAYHAAPLSVGRDRPVGRMGSLQLRHRRAARPAHRGTGPPWRDPPFARVRRWISAERPGDRYPVGAGVLGDRRVGCRGERPDIRARSASFCGARDTWQESRRRALWRCGCRTPGRRRGRGRSGHRHARGGVPPRGLGACGGDARRPRAGARHVAGLREGPRSNSGGPSARFQAVSHHLAIIASEVALARVAVESAIDATRHDEPAPLVEVAVAKVICGRAARVVPMRAHQVHGAIGFTQEYSLQLFTRRLWAWRDEFGSEFHWARALAERAAEDGFWGVISATQPPTPDRGDT